ncbi:MAG TPA: hypothetical protein DEB06_06365 [Phycisphaerales bacterium]|nr:hypothetical protein [Phycisphaerales bacterium]
MNRHSRNAIAALSGAALMALCGAGVTPSIASEPAPAPTAPVAAGSTSSTSWSDGVNRVIVQTTDGKTSITVNGRTLAEGAEAYEDAGAGLKITRERGHVVVTLKDEVVLRHAESSDGLVWLRHLAEGGSPAELPEIRAWRQNSGGTEDLTVAVARPRVMIGVTMDPASHDGVPATAIRRVIEGLPAARAGLKEGDVITRVDGAASADPEAVRAALRALEPGQTLNLTIQRDARPMDIALTVDAFDPARLGEPLALGAAAPLDSWFGLRMDPQDSGAIDALRARLNELNAELASRAQSLAGAAPIDARDLVNQISAITTEILAKSAEMAAHMQGSADPRVERLHTLMRREYSGLPNLRFRSSDGALQGLLIPTPSDPGAVPLPRSAPGDERLDQVNERLDRLESMLQRLLEVQGAPR